MIQTTVKIKDTAAPFLAKALALHSNPQPINQALAEGATAKVQSHFSGLSVTNRNRFGLPGSFWQRMLGGTKALATHAFGYVLMPRPVALRYFGGTVRPVRTKFLAIPARAEAHNRSPRDFNDLRFVKTRSGGMLVQAEQTTFRVGPRGGRRDRRRVGGGVFYWLVRSVTIREDQGVLPTMNELAEAAIGAGEGYIRRRLGI